MAINCFHKEAPLNRADTGRNQIDILLSTYNGSAYIAELMDSIFAQTFSHWKLIIRDDGSTDSTKKIIGEYKKAYPDQILVVQDNLGNLGPGESFTKLIRCSFSPYVAFCDQDDVWLPEKLETQLGVLKEVEREIGKDQPVLVHCDLMVCDKDLNCIRDSFWKYQHLSPEKMKDIRCLLIQNFVTGCTILMNRPLAGAVTEIPGTAIMFDWWIALMAITLGRIETVHKSLIKYRQHGLNTVGAQKWGISAVTRFAKQGASIKSSLDATKLQAKALKDKLNEIDNFDDRLITAYIQMFGNSRLLRKRNYLQLRIRKYGFLRQLVTWLLI